MAGVEYASSPAGDALADFNRCCNGCRKSEEATLFRLLFDFLENTLRCKRPEKLAAYLGSRSVWRWHGEIPVYKTSGIPCCAYTALDRGSEIVILVLGFCTDYPGTEDDWWSQTIQPRLIDHL